MQKAGAIFALLVIGALAFQLPAGEEKPTPLFEAAQPMTFPEFKADAYPSLVVYDVDKDGTPEVISSGVRGRLTISKRSAPGALNWIGHTPWMSVEGKQIDFHNW